MRDAVRHEVRHDGDARTTALHVLIDCRTAEAWADISLKNRLAKAALSQADAALCSRLVYGVLQNRILLDYYLQHCCTRLLEQLQPPLLDILRLGAYQILYLDRVPDRAAVHEAVEMTKRCGRTSAAGLVNAVLRKLSQNRENLPELPKDDSVRYLSIRYSHPRWLVKRLLPILGQESTEAFLRANNEAPPVTVQVNPLRCSLAELRTELTAAGVSASPHPWVPDCLNLTGTGDMTRLSAYQTGHFIVQDGAARLVTWIAGVQPGQQVLDLCAAPGGKAFSAAFAMRGDGMVLACDIYGKKLRRMQETAVRLGVENVRTEVADARQRYPHRDNMFDTVLVDAPCSGFGIIRKKPDIRYKRLNELLALPVIQRSILDHAAAAVRSGGVLVYSTCTILPDENEAVIRGFLNDHPDFSTEPFALPSPVGDTSGEITLWPQIHQTDGFYICKMRKV